MTKADIKALAIHYQHESAKRYKDASGKKDQMKWAAYYAACSRVMRNYLTFKA